VFGLVIVVVVVGLEGVIVFWVVVLVMGVVVMVVERGVISIAEKNGSP